jgi:hypothetical protein
MEHDESLPRLFADFQNADEHGRVRLSINGTKADLRRLGIELSDGMQVMLDDDQGQTGRAVVRWSAGDGWVAEVNWDAITWDD